MAITFEQIQDANKTIKTMPIERKDKKTGKVSTKEYAIVNEKIKAFRQLYPEGSILTDLISDNGERCVFKATITDGEGRILGTGTAFELQKASFINNTSYIENCETSAVGRALSMCGIGIDVSIASYEEVANAMLNQDKKKEEKEVLPTIEEDKPKKEETQATVEQAQGAYPAKDVMLALAKDKYPEGSKNLKQLLEMWKIDSIEKATVAQLMVVWNKYGNK